MIGQRVKELRTRANLTQQELAEGIISRTYLSLIEKNSVHPSTNVLKKLSERLNCTLDDFTTTAEDVHLSLLDIKKEIKWAENQVLMNEFQRLPDFLNRHYEKLDVITEYERATVYFVNARYEYSKENYEAAKTYLDETIGIVHKMKDVTLYLRALELYGMIHFELQDIDQTIECLAKANNVTIVESVSNTNRVSILSRLAEYYRLVGENYTTINMCHDALLLNKKLKTHHRGEQIHNTLGKVYISTKKPALAEEHIRKALSYAKLSDEQEAIVGTMLNLIIFLYENNRIDEAYDAAIEALALIDREDLDTPYKINISLRYAQVLLAKGEIDQAIEIVKLYIDEDKYGFATEVMGDISVAQGNFEAAQTYYLNSVEADDHPVYIARLHHKLAQCYLKSGSKDEAIAYLQKSVGMFEDIVPNML